jgi:site-specific DNA recombinase
MAGKLNNKRCAIYARYSSDQQRPASIEDQIRECRKYIAAEGGVTAPIFEYEDRAVTGATRNRRGFVELMAAAKSSARPFDVVVIDDLSRISRDMEHSAGLLKQVRFLGVPLISVSDGIDTSAEGSELSYWMKSMIADFYRVELAKKTRRGMRGRAIAGLATGALPYGYRSEEKRDGLGNTIGYRMLVDEKSAAIIRRIFTEYAAGHSYATIAAQLNEDNVPPPRPRRTSRKPSWVSSAIREMLRNGKYAGTWSWGRRRWERDPSTDKRVPRLNAESECVIIEIPELRIVDEITWNAVKARFDEPDRRRQERRGRSPAYLLSGLLVCGECGANMTICGGDTIGGVPRRYYRCDAQRKRGTCENRLSVKETVARDCVLAAVKQKLSSPRAAAYIRKQLEQRIRSFKTGQVGEREMHEAELRRTEGEIRNLLANLAQTQQSAYAVTFLSELEARATEHKEAIAALQERGQRPPPIPRVDELAKRVLDLDEVLGADINAGREALRRLFKGGTIELRPGTDGVYTAHAEALPMVLLAERTTPLGSEPNGGVYPNVVAGAGFEPTTFGL